MISSKHKDTDLNKGGEGIKGPLIFILRVVFDDSFLEKKEKTNTKVKNFKDYVQCANLVITQDWQKCALM